MKTLVALVLDESGSMHPTASDTIGAVNGYFEKLAEDSPDALVSIIKFSDHGVNPYRVLCRGQIATNVPELSYTNYNPSGNTPLYDAIGHTIKQAEEIDAERYLLVIMTDGQENASKEWSVHTIKALIEEKQAQNWTIVYLGANQDAWDVGQTIGVYAGSTMSYTQSPAGVGQTMRNLAGATSTYTSSTAVATPDFFSDAGQTAEDYEEPKENE